MNSNLKPNQKNASSFIVNRNGKTVKRDEEMKDELFKDLFCVFYAKSDQVFPRVNVMIVKCYKADY